MHDTMGVNGKLPWKPLAATVVGAAIATPIPVLAGRPDLIPGWMLDRFLGAPVLAWAVMLLMLGLVLLVLTTISFMDATGA